MSHAHVLVYPSPLGARAQDFLTAHARVLPVEPGPSDDECRAVMRSVLGYGDESVLATFRRIQHRYSGLTYFSHFRGAEIVFEPAFEVDRDTGQVVFEYAVMDATPDGCRSGFVRPDEAVWFGFLHVDVPAFPSLDHFLECDALLHHARQQRLLSAEMPSDANAHLTALRARHPGLRPVNSASGFSVGWWSDDERLVCINGFEARLAADGRGMSPVPTVVTTWLIDEPLR
ncbi:hypothetical protein [Paractinoplanes ferrugineus]|nr:hypothetical protein [Actinoplanes ferrugineus]